MPENSGADLGAMSDLCTPWCVHVVATLRIAELIAAGKNEIAELAAAAGCDSYALGQVLTYLVGKGVFEEATPGRFALNQAARGLLEPGQRIGLDLEGIGGRMAHAWGTLLSYVRTGAPAYHERFGRPFWADLDAHPEVGASFDALMGLVGHGSPDPEFPIAGGWEKVHRIVDVGGGTGEMLAELLRRHPAIHGTLVDFPRTVARAGSMFAAAGVAERVTVVGQSFFDPLPAGADLYLLRKILNGCPDREARAVLGRCAWPRGQVVALWFWGASVRTASARALSIEMVLLGGKHRTVAEFEELARETGLEVIAAVRQPSGYFVVECRPA